MENNIENLHPKGRAGIERWTIRLLAATLDHSTTALLQHLQMY